MINAYNNRYKVAAAWTLIQYLTAREQQRKMALGAGFLPTMADLYEDREILDQVPVIAAGKEAIPNSRNRPATPFYDQISPRIARMFNLVLRGTVNGTEGVAALEEELLTILRKNR